MINEQVDLYKYFNLTRPSGAKGYLYIYDHYIAKEYCENRKRPAMLVVAGGGYSYVSDREKEPIALAYFSQGYNAYTLEYSVAPVFYPAQLIEGAMAVAYLRENAERLHILEDKIACVGFSAGGHLVGMLATLFDEQILKDTLKERAKLCRPDAIVLGYPVISSDYPHQGSFDNIANKDKLLMEKLSLEKRVTKNSPPAFIWTTRNDDCVPSINSLLYAEACQKNDVQYELHIFRNGPHGLSVSSLETDVENFTDYRNGGLINPHVANWIKLSIEFLSELGFNFTK